MAISPELNAGLQRQLAQVETTIESIEGEIKAIDALLEDNEIRIAVAEGGRADVLIDFSSRATDFLAATEEINLIRERWERLYLEIQAAQLVSIRRFEPRDRGGRSGLQGIFLLVKRQLFLPGDTSFYMVIRQLDIPLTGGAVELIGHWFIKTPLPFASLNAHFALNTGKLVWFYNTVPAATIPPTDIDFNAFDLSTLPSQESVPSIDDEPEEIDPDVLSRNLRDERETEDFTRERPVLKTRMTASMNIGFIQDDTEFGTSTSAATHTVVGTKGDEDYNASGNSQSTFTGEGEPFSSVNGTFVNSRSTLISDEDSIDDFYPVVDPGLGAPDWVTFEVDGGTIELDGGYAPGLPARPIAINTYVWSGRDFSTTTRTPGDDPPDPFPEDEVHLSTYLWEVIPTGQIIEAEDSAVFPDGIRHAGFITRRKIIINVGEEDEDVVEDLTELSEDIVNANRMSLSLEQILIFEPFVRGAGPRTFYDQGDRDFSSFREDGPATILRTAVVSPGLRSEHVIGNDMPSSNGDFPDVVSPEIIGTVTNRNTMRGVFAADEGVEVYSRGSLDQQDPPYGENNEFTIVTTAAAKWIQGKQPAFETKTREGALPGFSVVRERTFSERIENAVPEGLYQGLDVAITGGRRDIRFDDVPGHFVDDSASNTQAYLDDVPVDEFQPSSQLTNVRNLKRLVNGTEMIADIDPGSISLDSGTMTEAQTSVWTIIRSGSPLGDLEILRDENQASFTTDPILDREGNPIPNAFLFDLENLVFIVPQKIFRNLAKGFFLIKHQAFPVNYVLHRVLAGEDDGDLVLDIDINDLGDRSTTIVLDNVFDPDEDTFQDMVDA